MGFKVTVVTKDTFNYEEAVNKYNGLMWSLGYDHVTIGTESTDGWNIRDMVAECDYVLSTYYEDGHANYDLRNEDLGQWRSDTMRLKNFITKYYDVAMDYVCESKHCSELDCVYIN